MRRLVQLAVKMNRASLRPAHLRGIVPILGAAAGYVAAPGEAGEEFYSAAAQIIPVLLLVLAVEVRFFRFEAGAFRLPDVPSDASVLDRVEATAESEQLVRATRTLYATITLVILTVGEFVALHPLTRASAETGSPRWVYAALAGGFVAIAMLALLGAPAKQDEG